MIYRFRAERRRGDGSEVNCRGVGVGSRAGGAGTRSRLDTVFSWPERGPHFSPPGGALSGVGGIDAALVRRGGPSIPAAVAVLLLDARVALGLVAQVALVGQHVGPEALVLGRYSAG